MGQKQKVRGWVVDTDYACFGIFSEDGIVTHAPPIAKWAIGKPDSVVLNYYKDKKQARIMEVGNED